jgi:hypothetical protein
MIRKDAQIAIVVAGLLLLASGCAAPYPGLVKPEPRLGVLSPELENLSEAKLRQTKGVRPTFPTSVAIAKITAVHGEADYAGNGVQSAGLDVPQPSEADGWRKLVDLRNVSGGAVVSQVQFIAHPVGGPPSLKTLRDAATALHAPLLLVYMEVDRSAQGQNSSAPAYWTGVGMFFVPGETIGYYSVCQGVIVDVRTGAVVSTLSSESRREENVTPGQVSGGRQRIAGLVQADAVSRLQRQAAESLKSLNLTTAAQPAPTPEQPARPARPASAPKRMSPAKGTPALQGKVQ